MIQILLCDDDIQFSNSLQNKVRSILDTNKTPASIFSYNDPKSIPQKLLETANIFFLDIDFTGMPYNGLDIAKKIRQYSNDAIIIFVTNYIQYAPEGYEIQAFRYLIKNEIPDKLEEYLFDAINEVKATQEKITINISREPTTFLLTEILYVEAQGHIILIHTMRQGSSKTYKLYTTMAAMEEELSPLGFLRTQKSYLVNMRHIDTYQCEKLILDNGDCLPVSEKYYADQKKKYLLWKGQH